MDALPGHISRYEIKSLIGRGGMGDLYLAFDPNTNRLVAIKLLNATLDSNELRQRFSREARALAALNHTNIVNIYDTGEFEDSPFIVMEYVRGETLSELIKRRAPLSVAQKLKLMAELCAGLAQAHEVGIIHRDIKPANLMVDQQGRLKILDFGIARVAEGGRTRIGLPLTQVNMLIGTPGYMSPEQIEGGEVDHRSDIFAVGAVCYELLASNQAFAGTNTRQIESRVLRGQPAPLASVVPGLDPEIDEIVLRALKRDPNRRYQDAATFEKALERLRSRLGPDPAGPPRRPTPPPPPQSVKGKSRESRAEAAYQRALAAHNGGAPEAARRFAVEALAEAPSHAAARALLARLPRGPLTHTAQTARTAVTAQTAPPPKPAAATVAGTAAGGASTSTAASTVASEETILFAPTVSRRPPAFWKQYLRPWSRDGSSRKQDGPFGKRDAPGKRNASPITWHEAIWTRDRRAALAVGLFVIIVGIVGVAAGLMLLLSWLRPSGQLLTIGKPEGGTISAPGINCGTHGADCSTNRPTGDAIELIPEADAGFTFVAYTGDCAPGGRTVMTMARTCGATFAPGVATAPPTQPLRIAPVPTGGTIQGVDIMCGTNGSICSANHPEGVPVELHPIADAGFTFMGFGGDCAPTGQTQMTIARTCNAVFSPTAEVFPPRPGGRGRGEPPITPAPQTPPPNTTKLPTPLVATAPDATPAPPGTTPTPGVTPPVSPTTGPTAQGGRGTGQQPTSVDPTKVPVPESEEEFAKKRILEVLDAFCAGYASLQPAAIKAVFPKADTNALQLQMKQYASAECKFGEPKIAPLDAAAGKAKVQAELKRGYVFAGTSKPEEYEQIATLMLYRTAPRGSWLIDTVEYKAKPKK